MMKNNNNQSTSIKPYRPSNSTDGDIFIDKHCMQCKHCDPDPDGQKQCNIMLASMVYDTNDTEYPHEWQYDANNDPTCTKHEQWDWDMQGNPDNPKKPASYVPKFPSNQLELFKGYGQI